MTNFERWQIYTKNFTSPDSWITFGFYFMIGAALQRRVWFYGEGEDGMELFCNPYIVFVGPPASGKGLVLGTVANFLRHHKYEKAGVITTNVGKEYPPLFPLGGDSITFEELLRDIGASTRRIATGGPKDPIYVHTSYAFCLEELSSLFKRKTEDVVKFLQNAYDCKQYEYRTKHQGKDLLRKLCVSFLAGTQVSFLKEASEAKIFGQGFASRTLFLFEKDERFHRFHISQFDDEQKTAKAELLDWLKKLSCLYGEIKYDAETYGFLEAWLTEKLIPARARAAGTKLEDYFGRKKVMMLKLAAAIHFADNLSLTIPIQTFMQAIEMLDSVEEQMIEGFGVAGKNDLHYRSREIMLFIKKNRRVTMRDLIREFIADSSIREIEECLIELEVGFGLKKDEDSGKTVYYL